MSMAQHSVTERLKHLAEIRVSNVDKRADEEQQAVQLCNYTDVYYNDLITADLDFMKASATPSQVKTFSLNANDVLITKDSETAEDIAVPAFVPESIPGVVCGYHLAIIRPNQPKLDGKYLFWYLTSAAARNRFTSEATGVTRFGLRFEAIANLRISLPTPSKQRLVANFLDTETARIDALIEKRMYMAGLLQERHAALIERSIRDLAAAYEPAPLRYAVDRVEVGIVITPAAWYSEDGVFALRGINVKPDRIVMDDAVRISHEGHAMHGKSMLRCGDLVVVRTGQAGAAAVVPPELDGANCVDLVIIRPSPNILPRYLEYVLNSDWTQKHIERHSVGTIQSHFNVGAMKGLPIPVPSLETQEEVVSELDRTTKLVKETLRATERQVELMKEHRLALITAAVTGQIEVGKE